MEDVLLSLKERCKRTVLRKIETGEVTFDQNKKIFVYRDTNEEYKLQKGDDGEEDDESDEDQDNDSEKGDRKDSNIDEVNEDDDDDNDSDEEEHKRTK